MSTLGWNGELLEHGEYREICECCCNPAHHNANCFEFNYECLNSDVRDRFTLDSGETRGLLGMEGNVVFRFTDKVDEEEPDEDGWGSVKCYHTAVLSDIFVRFSVEDYDGAEAEDANIEQVLFGVDNLFF
jgi:hypothetical protein